MKATVGMSDIADTALGVAQEQVELVSIELDDTATMAAADAWDLTSFASDVEADGKELIRLAESIRTRVETIMRGSDG
jgi:hypothetical protein